MCTWLTRLGAAAAMLVHAIVALGAPPSLLTIKVLYDNESSAPGVAPDWGFSCLITGAEKSILFDTGAKGDVLLANAEKMGVDWATVDVAVISHDHGDHTGGLAAVLERHPRMTVYLPASCAPSMRQRLEGRGARVEVVTKPTEICPDVTVVGPVGEDIVEQVLAVSTSQGLVVLTGCSHPGVSRLAKRVKDHLHSDIHLLCGGLHLVDKSEAEVTKLARELRELGIRQCGPTHCSGDTALRVFRQTFGEGFVGMGAGRTLQIGDARK